jgi:phosphatidylserine/phosphatidylglycerophosphate/cardiolipin synthase-like enzyme
MATFSVEVYANNDDATIVIQKPVIIKDCWGFAIYRKRQGETDLEAEPLVSSVGFAGDPQTQDETRPTTEWPIQRYIWTDFSVKTGDVISYMAIPMIGSATGLTKDMANKSDWSAFVTIGNTANSEAYFNRGLVSSQFVSRRLASFPDKVKKKTLEASLLDESSELRQFMGGNLSAALYQLLEDVAKNPNQQIYTALYELDEPGLIKRLNAIGQRAHVILANGAFSGATDPQAAHAKLLTEVQLTRRIVKTPHFAHNKFLVVTEKQPDDKELAIKVWTGSTNWTVHGLYTQVNNAVVIRDPDVTAYYKTEWDKMQADSDATGHAQYGKDYIDFNSTVKTNTAGTIHTYFTPVGGLIDMNEANKYIRAAQKGILFLMFKPGVEGKSVLLYDTIREMAGNKKLLVNGVINGDPGSSDHPTIEFINKNNVQQGSLDMVTPTNINDPFEYWKKEVSKENVTIHSKIILIDPFSDNPVLITGSHNMGGKASADNDDNLNLIFGNKDLARAYAVHMTAVYQHYRWRFFHAAPSDQQKWDGNVKSDEWQSWYTTGEKAKEIAFWTT